jgi:hypothetical protein
VQLGAQSCGSYLESHQMEKGNMSETRKMENRKKSQKTRGKRKVII